MTSMTPRSGSVKALKKMLMTIRMTTVILARIMMLRRTASKVRKTKKRTMMVTVSRPRHGGVYLDERVAVRQVRLVDQLDRALPKNHVVFFCSVSFVACFVIVCIGVLQCQKRS